jgi:hypothetical protein
VGQVVFIIFIIAISILIELTKFTNNLVLGQTSFPMRNYVSQDLGLNFQYPSPWGKARSPPAAKNPDVLFHL